MIKLISIADVPKQQRNRPSRIVLTQDWRDMVAAVEKPDFEAVRVDFAPETLEFGKTPLLAALNFRRRAVATFRRRKDVRVRLIKVAADTHALFVSRVQ